jgi:acetylornithine deacetylase/succinyl-diaminopimelate desuccinylase-like protein
METWLTEKILDLAVTIQQIPSPTFAERERAHFVREQFVAADLSEVEMDEMHNVFARLPGAGSGLPLVVSAHTDTVFPAESDLNVQRQDDQIAGPGIGDNALGVAGLFGLLWGLRARDIQLPGDLIFVANVGEEGLGNCRGMRAVVDRFGSDVRAYIVLEGVALGHIFNRGTSVRRYKISAHTAGGHSWVDYGDPSAVHELTRLVAQLTALSLPERPRTTLNVGIIAGGTSVNTVASHAEAEIDLRSESSQALTRLAARVHKAVDAFNRSGTGMEIEPIGERPYGELAVDHPLVMLAKSCLKDQGVEPILSIGSTDASIPLSRGLPAVCIGLTTGKGAHTLQEYIHTKPLIKGLEQLLGIVEGAYNLD